MRKKYIYTIHFGNIPHLLIYNIKQWNNAHLCGVFGEVIERVWVTFNYSGMCGEGRVENPEVEE